MDHDKCPKCGSEEIVDESCCDACGACKMFCLECKNGWTEEF